MEQTAQSMNQSFLACLGTDLLVACGDRVAETNRRFQEFYAEYALIAERFANPDLIITRRHRDAGGLPA